MTGSALHDALDRVAAPASPPSDELVTSVLRRGRARRSRRRLLVASAACVVLALCVGVSVRVVDSHESNVSVVAPSRARDHQATLPVVRFDLPSRRLNGAVLAYVSIDNRTGSAIPYSGCLVPPLAFALSDGTHLSTYGAVLSCRQDLVLRVGRTKVRYGIPSSSGVCRTESGDACPPVLELLNLPDGRYELSVELLGDLQMRLPKPITVLVSTAVCDTQGAKVVVPDVVGMRLPDALERVRQSQLNVNGFGVARDDPTYRSARVIVQEPPAGARVPKGSCIGFRTR